MHSTDRRRRASGSALSQGVFAFGDEEPVRTRWGTLSRLSQALLGEHAPKPVKISEIGAKHFPAGIAVGAASPADQVNASDIEVTPEYLLVREAVHRRVPAVFVTGKAGTGKSTLIRYLTANVQGCAVVAPTAIAALNVSGDTIHAFFGIPPATVDPNDEIEIRPKVRSVLRAITALIVDEVSMVTPNLVDRIDKTLRIARGNDQPFGGITLIFVGDLLQLPPVVVSEEELQFFADLYGGVYFFLAKVFERVDLLPVALTQVRRQSDQEFIDALSRIRAADDHREMVGLLNRRCFLIPRDAGQALRGIYLVTTNAQAAAINTRELRNLPSDARTYDAKITGDANFKNGREPAASVLELGEKKIRVRKLADGSVQDVEPYVWERIRYEYNLQERRLERRLVATYEQFPLALGWAITIHKSQGMSLDEVVLDLGQGAFAQGQAYVGLSRCRTMEGLRLVRPIGMRDVKVDSQLIEFYKDLGLG